jgi:ATP-dependent helicase HrpB
MTANLGEDDSRVIKMTSSVGTCPTVWPVHRLAQQRRETMSQDERLVGVRAYRNQRRYHSTSKGRLDTASFECDEAGQSVFRGGRARHDPGRAGIPQLLGLTRTPTVADGRVPVVVHLLAPNGRPAQVTQDLASFWRSGYAEVRRQLRGRYPKHAWPEDPLAGRNK